jgi:hypothetical protein
VAPSVALAICLSTPRSAISPYAKELCPTPQSRVDDIHAGTMITAGGSSSTVVEKYGVVRR